MERKEWVNCDRRSLRRKGKTGLAGEVRFIIKVLYTGNHKSDEVKRTLLKFHCHFNVKNNNIHPPSFLSLKKFITFK